MSSSRGSAPVGVLLFNLGGPDTLDAVEPFLINIFSDRDIIELPLGSVLQPIVARLIAWKRGPSVRDNYRSIGGGSPQLALTRAQGAALQERLNRNGGAFKYFVAMRYWHPSTAEALTAMAAEGIDRVVTVTMYPQYSCATTGSSERELQRHLDMPQWRGRFRVSGVAHYHDDPLYLEAMTDMVRRALDGFPTAVRDRAVLLFSAHGLPQKFVDRGDPYVAHIEVTRQGIVERLNVVNRQVLGYQSRTGPVKWIGPGTDEVIRALGREGVREVLLIPLSFVSDHIETLYEVDQLFASDARRAGIVDYRRPEALNTHPLFIEALARRVERELESSA
jgi:protoporphyrin/coproporphyrin ferrochelatase